MYKKLIFLCLLAGCASTSTTAHLERDFCKEAGGVWYKGPMDSEYRCVDEQSLRDNLRRMQTRIFR